MQKTCGPFGDSWLDSDCCDTEYCVEHSVSIMICQAWKNSSPAKKRSLKRLLSEAEDPGADRESTAWIGVNWIFAIRLAADFKAASEN